jgi:molecular chaperone GrpE
MTERAKPASGNGDFTADASVDGAAQSEPRPSTLEEALTTIERLRAELAAKADEEAQYQDRYLRERAELENFKRRIQREKAEALRYANEPLLRDLLPIIDDLERAVAAARTTRGSLPESPAPHPASLEGLTAGVEMVLRKCRDVLIRVGATRLESAGKAFDPNCHEALAQIETHEHPEGTVVTEHAAGYTLHDRLLRAAQVVVAKAPSNAGKNSPGQG